MTMVWSPATTAMNTIVQEGGDAEGGDGPGAEGGRGAHRAPAEEVTLGRPVERVAPGPLARPAARRRGLRSAPLAAGSRLARRRRRGDRGAPSARRSSTLRALGRPGRSAPAATGERVRAVVGRVRGGAARSSRLGARRLLDGGSLEASTDPGRRRREGARRAGCVREEKPLYDRGQRLRAAVETNREEGRRARTRSRSRAPRRRRALGPGRAARARRRGRRIVRMETAALPPRSPGGVAAARLCSRPALLLVVLRWRSAGGRAAARRALLLASAPSLLLAGRASATVAADRAAWRSELERRIAEHRRAAAAVAERARTAIAARRGSAGRAAPLDPPAWDPTPTAGRSVCSRRARRRRRDRVAEACAAPPRRLARASSASGSLGARAPRSSSASGAAARLLATLPTLPRRLRLRRSRRWSGCCSWSSSPSSTASSSRSPTRTSTTRDKPISEIWVGLEQLHRDPRRLPGRQARRPTAGSVFNYQNFYWTLGFTVVWTVTNVAIGVTRRAPPRPDPEHQGARAEAGLPGAADPALGDAELHHGADLEGDVPPAVRRREPDHPDVRRAAGRPGSRSR